VTTYPANFEDADGVVRLSGQIDFTDANDQPGGNPSVNQAVYLLSATGAPSGANTAMTWAFNYGTALLDLSTATQPKPLTAGVYAVTWAITPPTDATAGTVWVAGVDIDLDNFDAGASFGGEIDILIPGVVATPLAASLTCWTPAGSPMFAQVTHNDTGNPRDFSGRAVVQMI